MEYITMSRREREQLIVFSKIKNAVITRVEAALQLKISERWLRKKYKRYLIDGDVGLVHRNRGRASPNRWCEEERILTINLLRSDWHGFGPTFTAEKLAELENITVSKETVRQAMIAAGLWRSRSKKPKYRQRRVRRAMIGVMVQLDGSPHDWFEGRAPKCTLLVFIDDATSQILWLEFVDGESKLAVTQATKNCFMKHGIPLSFYVDFGGVFSVNLNNLERDKKTQWERIMKELSVEVIHAYSPQAKGRVERANKTMQDRLIKEMRLAKISSIEAANTFLRGSNFISKHNAQFAVPPAQVGNAHRSADLYDLDSIFCFKEERILANDFTILYNTMVFQLDAQQRTIIRPKNVITVNTYLDGTIKLSIRQTGLTFKEIDCRKQPQEKKIKEYTPCKPGKNSQRWVFGLPPLNESRVKPASPAVEAI